jgi:hypothetical protein
MVTFSTAMTATVQLIMMINMTKSKATVTVEKDILFGLFGVGVVGLCVFGRGFGARYTKFL